jgi:hypothetical protein
MNLLVLALVAQAAQAAPLPPDSSRNTATAAAEQVAHAAQQLRGDATIAAALQTVDVRRDDAEQALAALGFETALDLRLLAGGLEAAELMTALRTGSKLSIADRAKIRLLVGDSQHLARVSASTPSSSAMGCDQDRDESAPRHHRQLQDQGTDRSTLSADTIAIVFSVCVGVCGYLLQAWTAEKASRHAGDLQHEHDQQARDRQVEQDRAVAQIRRTERWVDDWCSPVGRALGQYLQSRQRFGKCCCG